MNGSMRRMAVAMGVVAGLCAYTADAATLVVDIAGGQGFGAFGGDSRNTVRTFDIGANARVTGVDYDGVAITARTPSFLSEATLGLTDSTGTRGIFLSPGIDDDFGGDAVYRGSLDLTARAIEYAVGADGILRVEFFDRFEDGVDPDSAWTGGTVSITYDAAVGAVPEPATWGMTILGFGCAGAALRRRSVVVKRRSNPAMV